MISDICQRAMNVNPDRTKVKDIHDDLSILMTFASIAYRVLLATNVSAANVYTFLGSLDECQGTIAEDEINNLDNDPEKLNIYKSGYSRGTSRIPKIDLKSGRIQEVFNTYCFKIFASESSLDNSKAGLEYDVGNGWYE
ncbi:MAG: hypothetical protein WA667_17335 [Candidatus Nitrosopolaris sp.]